MKTSRDINMNPGNTSVPLINISPFHCNRPGEPNLGIQVQDHNLKYYYEKKGDTEFNALLQYILERIGRSSGKFNKPNANRGKTNFIYLERLDQSVIHTLFSVDDFVNWIIAFYEKMDTVVRNRFAS